MPSHFSLSWSPILPVWLALPLIAGLAVLLAYGSRVLLHKGVPRRWVFWLAGLRVAIVLVFALVLLQPILSYQRTVERMPEMLVLLDTSQSMDQPGAGSESRLAEVVPGLQTGGLGSALHKRFRLHWYAFDRTAVPVEKSALATLKPLGDATLFADSLTAAWSQVTQEGPGAAVPERVLLVSDGRDQGQADLVEAAKRLGVAIDVLAPQSPPDSAAPAHISIREVQASRRVLLGSETHFQATLQFDRAAGERQVQLVLSENGKDLETRPVAVGRGRTETRVQLAHRPAETGVKTYQLRLKIGDKEESSPYPVSVQVVDGKNEVLILEDSWRWEFKYLRRVLEDDPSFRFTALLSRNGGAFMQFASHDRRLPLVGFPQNRAQLAGVDVVMLGDVNPRRWPRELAPALRDLVAEEGRSLVVMAGPNLAHWLGAPDLFALLPVEITRETATPLTGPVNVRLSAEGARSPLFFQTAGAKGEFPPLDQIYPPLRKKPAATVLVEAAQQANAYGPLIVVAEQTVGRGRVVFIGTDTLWKWQTLGPSNQVQATIHRQFWQQALRALASPRLSGGSVNLWLQPERSRYESGQRVLVRAEIDAPKPLDKPMLQATVTLPDGKRFPLAFAPDGSAPGRFTAELEASAVGPYQISAAVLTGGKAAADTLTSIDVDPPRGERDGSPVDLANLTRIASSTGGMVVDPEQPDTWPRSAVQEHERVVVTRSLDLWNEAVLLVLLCTLLGVDWVLRLLRGYV